MSQITEYMTLGDREYWVGCIVRKDTFVELEEKRYKFAWDHIPDPFKEQYLEVLEGRATVGNLKKRIVVDFLANINDRIDESDGEDHELFKASRDFIFTPDAIERPVVAILRPYADPTLELDSSDSKTVEVIHASVHSCPCCKAERESMKIVETCVVEVETKAKEELIFSFAKNVAEISDVHTVEIATIVNYGVFDASNNDVRVQLPPNEPEELDIYIKERVDKIVNDAFVMREEQQKPPDIGKDDGELFSMVSSLPTYEVVSMFKDLDSNALMVYDSGDGNKTPYKSRYKNNRSNFISTKRQYVLGEIFGGAVQEFFLRGGSGREGKDHKRKKKRRVKDKKKKDYSYSNLDHDRDRYGLPVDIDELRKNINFDVLTWSTDFDIEGGTDWSGRVLNWSYSDNPYMVTNVFRDERNVICDFDHTFKSYDKCRFTSIELKLDFMSHIDTTLKMCVWPSTSLYLVDSMTLDEIVLIERDKKAVCYDIAPLGNRKVEYLLYGSDLFVDTKSLSFYWLKDGSNPSCFFINVAIYGLEEWPEEIGNVVSSLRYDVQWS